MDVVIREATEDDYEELKELFEQGATIHHEGEPAVIGPPSERPISRPYMSRLLSDGNSVVLVADLSGDKASGHRLAGFIHLALQDTNGMPGLAPRVYVLVMDVEVREAARGQGIGHKLMSAGDEWARDRGATQVELSVWEFNQRALALYEKLGYRTIFRQMLKQLPPQPDIAEN